MWNFTEVVEWFDKIRVRNNDAKRRALYSELLERALEAQQKESWTAALRLCRRAMKLSNHNGLARLNAFVCRYHLGFGSTIAPELVGNLHVWKGAESIAAAGLGMICASQAEMPAETKRIALRIAAKFVH